MPCCGRKSSSEQLAQRQATAVARREAREKFKKENRVRFAARMCRRLRIRGAAESVNICQHGIAHL